LDFSVEHYTLVTNVQHLSTNFISHQFHVVFDDLFERANNNGVDEPIIESICQDLFLLPNMELSAEEELDEAGKSCLPAPLPLNTV
jgi:hypothetical protein